MSLRRPEAADVKDLSRLLLDPQIQAWLRPRPLDPLSQPDVESLLMSDIEHWQTEGYGPWLVREQGVFRGRVGVRRSEVLKGVELAWAVMPEAWGRGIATRAGRAAIRLARKRELGHVAAFTTPHNRASVRVMERLGMTRAGEIEHAGLRHLLYRI